ncbi:MAG TPA: DUF502 domain-containing protein [Arenimonas sp.]|uniref:DUF502 domain-containing protein n=1 Tax=Arenimonas sp. TaxID=1872635 RepID=UPI002BF30963|nr:DUF502 domain-containing protein [Arenimonas sp.]HMB56791.1 DUF502 domain-containing protein [Arenimonas sp.]
MRKLQSFFLTGLLTLLPIWLVWIVFKFVFGLLSDVSRPVIAPLVARIVATDPRMLDWLTAAWVQTAIALIVTIAFIVVVGALARRAVGQKLLSWSEALIARVPLAKTVYGSARQLLDMLQTKPDGTQRVVLIDFPNRDMKSVGFVTRILHDENTGQELAAVYVPTTPNPTSGYLEVVPVERLTPTDWTVDQAMTFIISGGAVSPDRIPFHRPPVNA